MVSQSLHFWINDALICFLVVSMEIRREIHEGAPANLRLAALAAALGGVMVPAVFCLTRNGEPATRQGWAVPTATDIAFAVGVLALLGISIPSNVRVFLLERANRRHRCRAHHHGSFLGRGAPVDTSYVSTE